MDKTRSFGAPIIRIGVALIYLWFGFQQVAEASAWTGYLPKFVTDLSPLSATTLVHLNGAFEITFGLALLIGFFTRLSSALLALHMLHITLIVGWNAIGVRDFGVALATVAVFLNGADRFSAENFPKAEEEAKP